MSFDQRAYTTGSVYAWSLTPTRDGGQAWDVTGASVVLYVHQPGGAPLALAPVLVGGLWQASCGPADLSAPGLWLRTWEVTDAAGPHRCLPIPFLVGAAP
jgi:hypothetical protein